MSPENTFINRCLLGLSLPDEIDSVVQKWHEDPAIEMDLHEYIGFNPEEYSAWLVDASIIDSIIAARIRGVSLDAFLQGAIELPLAARGQGLSKDSAVVKWLKETGRLK